VTSISEDMFGKWRCKATHQTINTAVHVAVLTVLWLFGIQISNEDMLVIKPHRAFNLLMLAVLTYISPQRYIFSLLTECFVALNLLFTRREFTVQSVAFSMMYICKTSFTHFPPSALWDPLIFTVFTIFLCNKHQLASRMAWFKIYFMVIIDLVVYVDVFPISYFPHLQTQFIQV
jgi:hypothetical protein